MISDLPFDHLDQLDVALPSSRITSVFLPFSIPNTERIGSQIALSRRSAASPLPVLPILPILPIRGSLASSHLRDVVSPLLHNPRRLSKPLHHLFRQPSPVPCLLTNNPCRTRVFPWRQVAKRRIRRRWRGNRRRRLADHHAHHFLDRARPGDRSFLARFVLDELLLRHIDSKQPNVVHEKPAQPHTDHPRDNRTRRIV